MGRRRQRRSKWKSASPPGQQIEPEHVDDEDVKLMAINGLMNSDPDRAMPILEGILNSQQPAKMKERALFVLSQSGSPRAFDIVGERRRSGDSSRSSQSRAVRYLGILGGERSRGVLTDIYTSTNDMNVKKSVLKSYMIAGDRARLLALAKGEQNAELRARRHQQLGVLGARNELADLYSTEPSSSIRKKIIQAMFIGGNAEKLAEIARNEKVQELRVTAIRTSASSAARAPARFSSRSTTATQRPTVRKAVIKALFIQKQRESARRVSRASEKESS